MKGTDSTDFLSFEMLVRKSSEGESLEGNIFETAQREAEKIIARAKEDAVRIEQEAYTKGFEKGEEEALARGKKKLEEEVARLDLIFKELRGHYPELNTHYEKEVLLLIKTMVDRLVNHELSINPRIIQSCLLKAMEFVVENATVKVKINPEDFLRIKEAGFESPDFLQGSAKVQLVEDPAISRGGCLLETDFGEIDATLENCRDKLYQALDDFFIKSLGDTE